MLLQFILYIPHGSDNTAYHLGDKTIPIMLYIPHGSDNTSKEIRKQYNIKAFISHMVQIILAWGIFCGGLKISFISHMVQIIRLPFRR